MAKPIIYTDADDVILMSSVAIIDIINKKYNIQPPKSVKDLKDYDYKSICRKVSKQEKLDFFESDEFFNILQIDPVFLEYYQHTKDKYDWKILTVGSNLNFQKKESLCKQFMPDLDFIHVPLNQKKSDYNLSDGIQIDDLYSNLNSNAKLKILFKGMKETDYNQIKDIRNDLYVAYDWYDVIKMLEFFIAKNDFMVLN